MSDFWISECIAIHLRCQQCGTEHAFTHDGEPFAFDDEAGNP